MQASDNERVYGFVTEWFDNQASVVRSLLLKFFVLDGSIEMYDLIRRKTFLKRCPYPSITLNHLYIGGTVTVFSRLLKIVDYYDPFTRKAISQAQSSALLVLKTDSFNKIGDIIAQSNKAGLSMRNLKMVKLSQNQAREYLSLSDSKDETLTVGDLTSGNVVALEVVGREAADKTAQIMQKLGEQAPAATNENQSAFFFNNPALASPALQGGEKTVCLVKPHAVESGATGPILKAILQSGFDITALQLFCLDHHAAAEFLEVYKTVIPEFNGMVQELHSGPTIALELTGDNVVAGLRQLCGPFDPAIAKHIRANTLRAQFGVDKVHNAVHCTDLPDDGILESEFFFKILHTAQFSS